MSDCAEAVAANRESREYHWPWAEPFVDEAGFRDWLARSLTGAHLGLIARDREGGHIVGVVNLNNIITGSFCCAFLGYYGVSRYAGRGYMTDAVRQTVRHAFDDLGLHRLEANIQPGNAPSIALVKRLGFRKEGYSPRYLRIAGEWRDHERWAILADDLAPL
jgi:ribosomal-protein-alanine N-acetyltransferase